ncbi:MAG: 4'-phosphopantetheinyl transferase superfamily protein [Pseudotabrizicola sp.]|uniref:4'-phosphopantetheinyl transferase family protein n=1 Tax=Pseudotabrizicola sp. TaxID=2939647 RepID=UPI002717C72B|nr:4'-phosphopantetheinyl transferase superfamily protein [Pseudotabrizicola sp.]MDO9637175.1 4'-phosphopantetheinyl transferase superfamily protein [Pseudotabrizicola sp.]
MPDAGLLAALREIAPGGAGIGWADPRAEYALMPGEVLPGAVPARMREFAAGRTAARTALAGIGLAPLAIGQGADRAPVWPAGVAGSITHSRSQCLAVVMSAQLCRGIGIDLEEDTPLEPALWPDILRPEEQAGITGAQAKAVFCAKEAAFKAQYAVSRTLYGFDGMRVEMEGDRFAAVFMRSVPPFAIGDRISGRILRAGGHVLTLASL